VTSPVSPTALLDLSSNLRLTQGLFDTALVSQTAELFMTDSIGRDSSASTPVKDTSTLSVDAQTSTVDVSSASTNFHASSSLPESRSAPQTLMLIATHARIMTSHFTQSQTFHSTVSFIPKSSETTPTARVTSIETRSHSAKAEETGTLLQSSSPIAPVDALEEPTRKRSLVGLICGVAGGAVALAAIVGLILSRKRERTKPVSDDGLEFQCMAMVSEPSLSDKGSFGPVQSLVSDDNDDDFTGMFEYGGGDDDADDAPFGDLDTSLFPFE
jgi:hypothetical protein